MTKETLAIVVQAAYEYLMTALASSGTTSDKVSNFRMEESQTVANGNYKLTLSYDIVGEFAFDRQREYKDFEVTPAGLVVSMTIRKV